MSENLSEEFDKLLVALKGAKESLSIMHELFQEGKTGKALLFCTQASTFIEEARTISQRISPYCGDAIPNVYMEKFFSNSNAGKADLEY